MRVPARVVLAGVLLAGLVWGGGAEAAKLRRVGGHTSEVSIPERPPQATAQVVPAGMGAATAVSVSLTITSPPDCNAASAQSTSEYLIEPDPGEQVGDCVLVRYCWDFSASISTTGPAITALAGFGYTPSLACDPLVASCADPATIVVNPAGAATTIYSRAPINLASAPATASDQGCSYFTAVIGDTIRVGTAAAAGVEGTEAGSSGEASASASIDLELQRCAAGVPAAGQAGLVLLAVLLGVVAILRLRS